MFTRKTVLSIVIGGALIVALLAGAAAFAFPTAVRAQTGASNGAANPGAFLGGLNGELHGRGGPNGWGADMDKYLADALGITVEELQAARQKAEAAALADAVKNGDLTQEQADLIAARNALKAYINPEALMARVLGMTEAELQAARQSGKTMQDLATEKGLTQDQVKTAMDEAFKAAVAQAVTDGVITQAQADQISSEGFGRGGPMGEPGGHGGRGGHGGDWGFPGGPLDGSNTPQTQPSQTAPGGGL